MKDESYTKVRRDWSRARRLQLSAFGPFPRWLGSAAWRADTSRRAQAPRQIGPISRSPRDYLPSLSYFQNPFLAFGFRNWRRAAASSAAVG
jgi:hypothetical protein